MKRPGLRGGAGRKLAWLGRTTKTPGGSKKRGLGGGGGMSDGEAKGRSFLTVGASRGWGPGCKGRTQVS